MSDLLGPAARTVYEDDPGWFENAFRTVGRPGFALRSLLAGRPDDAVENLAMFGLEVGTGTFLHPWLRKNGALGLIGGDLTTRSERPEFSDLLDAWGVDTPNQGSLGRVGLDVVGGIFTDPLSFVGAGAGAGAKLGAGSLAGVDKASAVSKLLPALRMTGPGRQLLTSGLDDLGLAADDVARLVAGGRKLKGLGDDALGAADDVAEQILMGRGGAAGAGITGHMDQAPLLDAGLDALEAEGALVRRGVRVGGNPFGEGTAVSLKDLGLDWLPSTKRLARDVAGPAALGSVFGPAGSVAGLGINALSRKFRPEWAKAIDTAASELGEWATRSFFNRAAQGRHLAAGVGDLGRDAIQSETRYRSLFEDEVLRGMEGFTDPEARKLYGRAALELQDEHAAALRQLDDAAKKADRAFEAAEKKYWRAELRLDDLEMRGASPLKRARAEAKASRLLAEASEAERLHHQALEARRTTSVLDPEVTTRQFAERLTAQGVDPARAGELSQAFGASMRSMADTLVHHEQLPAEAARRFYAPLQANDELIEAVHAANPTAARDMVKRFVSHHTKDRKTQTLGQFRTAIHKQLEEAGLPELVEQFRGREINEDLGQIWARRANKHAKHRARLEFEEALKSRGMIGEKGMDAALRNYADRVFQEGSAANVPGAVERFNKVMKPINRIYKPALTSLFPGFHVRNAVSTLYQTVLDPALDAGDSLALGTRYAGDLLVAAKLKNAPADDVGVLLRAIGEPSEANLAAARAIKIGKYTGEEAMELARGGVVGTNHFTDAELLGEMGNQLTATRFSRTQDAKGWNWAVQHSGRVSRFFEDRARLGAYLALLDRGIDAREAIARVQRAFVNYDFNSWGERLLRDLFPFAKFTLGTAPVVASEVARRPGLVSPFRATAGSLEGDPENAYLRDKAKAGMQLPLGGGKFTTPYGLPMEAIEASSSVPKALSQAHPLLKLGLEAGTGRRLYDGTRFGSFTRVPSWLPGARKRVGKDGKVSHEIDGKLLEGVRASPLSRAAWSFQNLTSRDTIRAAFKLGTGYSIQDADREKRAKKVIEAYLEDRVTSGDVGAIERFYGRGKLDPALEDALKAIAAMDAERRKKKKRGY